MLVSDIVPRVAVFVGGCPEPVVAAAIVDAARALCQAAPVLRDSILHFSAANQMEYAMEVEPDFPEVLGIDGVLVDGVPMVEASPLKLRSLYQDWRREVGTPRYYTRESIFALNLIPAPASDGQEILIDVIIAPVLGATEIDDSFALWLDAIVDGALAYLFSIPKTEWFDSQAAEYRRSLSNSGIAAAASYITNGMSTSPIRTTPCF